MSLPEGWCNAPIHRGGFSIARGFGRRGPNHPGVTVTTPALSAPPLLNQEGSSLKCSPPQMS